MGRGKSLDDVDVYNSVNLSLHRATLTAPGIGYITVLKKDGSRASNAVPVSQPFQDYQSCLEYLKMRGIQEDSFGTSSVWYAPEPLPSSYLAEYGFVNIRSLRTLRTQELNGIMLAYIRESAVYDLYAFFGEESLIVRRDGVVLSAGDKSLIGKPAPVTKRYSILPDGKIRADESVSSVYLPELEAYLVAVPDYTVLSAMQQSTQMALLVLVILGLAFSLFCAAFLSSRLTRSVRHLKTVMEQVRGGDLSIRYEGRGTDEIAFLGTSFNILMDNLMRYIEEIKRNEQRQRENDLRLLQSQINPHLLYNTLDSALYFVGKNDMETAQSMLETLSDFFKLSLSKGRVMVPLETELRRIGRYMQIQRLCRGKEIELEVSCEEELLQACILKTTLQPIVENAYLHAYEGVWSQGTIELEVYRVGDALEIRLSDDGMGMDEETLRALQAALEEEEPRTGGFGLWNINQRLRTYYGAEYGLTVESESGCGTTVWLRIPYQAGENEGGMDHVSGDGGR